MNAVDKGWGNGDVSVLRRVPLLDWVPGATLLFRVEHYVLMVLCTWSFGRRKVAVTVQESKQRLAMLESAVNELRALVGVDAGTTMTLPLVKAHLKTIASRVQEERAARIDMEARLAEIETREALLRDITKQVDVLRQEKTRRATVATQLNKHRAILDEIVTLRAQLLDMRT